jgi:hypothetical protein
VLYQPESAEAGGFDGGIGGGSSSFGGGKPPPGSEGGLEDETDGEDLEDIGAEGEDADLDQGDEEPTAQETPPNR